MSNEAKRLGALRFDVGKQRYTTYDANYIEKK